ncbi:hypothetical protein [Metaclostridioides mangenotii]|uniref:Uncharacterized protein n=1 Tax=Metaclostridioides mangenotii TaxID=1540 RepID=A0ABS4E7Z1_9FIRM|nr:hypothetical protein [Clostridioides mangenotii]MBP1854044.1 hypothetical protein [Clostridioides mangenotii]
MNKIFKEVSTRSDELNSSISINIKESIKPIINFLSALPKFVIDLDKAKIFYYKTLYAEENDIVEMLYENTIFPQINLDEEKFKKLKYRENTVGWILKNDVKYFYLQRMNIWKDKYNDENITKMIDEIKFRGAMQSLA